MNRLLALAAFVALIGFLAILVIEVPSADLIVVCVFTAGLVLYDIVTSSGKRG